MNFDDHIKSARVSEPCYRCPVCDRIYTAETYGAADRESFPCPCGTELYDLEKWWEIDHPELQYRDEVCVTWDEYVKLMLASGFWRCELCGFTGPEEVWEHKGYGEDVISECPECGQVEDYEILGS